MGPLGVADGWMGWGWVWVCGGQCPMQTCMHACMHMHVKHVVNMISMDASMLAAICNFFICVCMCVVIPPMPPDTPHPPALSPEPQGAQNTKIQ